jgi:uncharacterized protein DUF5916/cellulose/xylan binding protein with CBM9 domain
MSKAAALTVVLAIVVATPGWTQNVHPTPPPEVRAVELHEEIHLDGKLDEAIWHTAPVATGFLQAQPNEGHPATQRTEVRFAYDDAAIYVGARMFDDSGANGVQTRLVRRDANANADYLEVIFDTYHDHIGRLFFTVNPSGVRGDANGLGGGSDDSWDPVWEVKTAIDSLGWTAEIRIPFSQLRYPSSTGEQTWGLQIWRQENRLNELSQWSFWHLNESGGPSRFGHLAGLVIHRAPGKAELLPYVVGRSTNIPISDPTDPFTKAHTMDGRIGADARYLVTSNLTLTATVNPDFGQVEVDPAVVNLTAFETAFDEKRPFFVEGSSYFGFGGLSCYFCSNVSSLSMFYSRRIGRSPQVDPFAYGTAVDTVNHADVPDNSTIIGAAKLTGRTRSGWSIGTMDAVTGRSDATVQWMNNTRSQVTVQPLTNYFVGRAQKDLRDGATVIRAMATSVYHDLTDTVLSHRLSKHAESFGLSSDMYFHSRDLHLMAQVAGTSVSGDSVQILRLERSSARYFQRPDHGKGSNGLLTNHLDSSLTSLRGLGAYARLAKEQGDWLWELSTNIRSPGFENNDIAFLSQADYAYMGGNIFRQWTKPTSWFRQLYLIGGGQQKYNFDGDLIDRQGQLFGEIVLLNYWDLNTFYIHRQSVLDDRLSRGGPVLRLPSLNYWAANLTSDRRKSIMVQGSGSYDRSSDGKPDWSTSLTLQLRPASNITLSLGPSYNYNSTSYQYVQAVPDSFATAFGGTRYVFADLVQHAVSMETRFNVTFTPDLTFELYVQPLIASGTYSRYKEFAAPRSLKKLTYGQDIGTVSVTTGSPNTITVDPDGAGPDTSFQIVDPSFTFRSLRGNAVLRWEYHPGATLYLVWTRESASSLYRGAIDFGPDARSLFQGPAQNIFLLKVNYWLGF